VVIIDLQSFSTSVKICQVFKTVSYTLPLANVTEKSVVTSDKIPNNALFYNIKPIQLPNTFCIESDINKTEKENRQMIREGISGQEWIRLTFLRVSRRSGLELLRFVP
jgi:hypothetical protein